MNFNRIIIIGRLTRDPEPKSTSGGIPVTTFTVAVDRPQSSEARQQGAQKETDFFDIVTWRQLAENAANYLQKGKLVVVEGRLQIRNYVSQDGQQRKAVEIVADTFRNLEKRSDGTGGDAFDDGGGYSQSNNVREVVPQHGRGGYEPRQSNGQSRNSTPASGGYRAQVHEGDNPTAASRVSGQGNRSGGGRAPQKQSNDFDDPDFDGGDPFEG